jgi:hypothetical protein
MLACGGPGSKPVVPSGSDAGAVDAALPQHLISTLPTDVRNPPPFALGSKVAKVHEHADWNACHASLRPSPDATKALDEISRACAAVTKMHALGAPMTGTQNATTSQPIAYKFHAQANHCYRVYGAAGPSVKSLVAVVTDSIGAEIAEYHTDDVVPFFAPDESLCFSSDNDAIITASVGIGDGAYAIGVWSD